MSGLISIVLVATSNSGCATAAVLEKWRSPEIRALTLQLREASPTAVKVDWRAAVAGRPNPSGTWDISPALQNCDPVRVLAARDGKPLTLRPRRDELLNIESGVMEIEVEDFWTSIGDGNCIVALHFPPAKDPQAVDVLASSGPSAISVLGTIRPPREHAWLLVLPFSVVADAAMVPIVVCLAMGEECGKALRGWVGK